MSETNLRHAAFRRWMLSPAGRCAYLCEVAWNLPMRRMAAHLAEDLYGHTPAGEIVGLAAALDSGGRYGKP